MLTTPHESTPHRSVKEAAHNTMADEPQASDAAGWMAVLKAGHHIVLASGRSLAGVLPVARSLDLADGWAVASNGAIIARLTPGGYHVELSDIQVVDTRQVVTAALNARQHDMAIAVEEIGVGYYVSEHFPAGLLRGEQTVLPVHELGEVTTPRVVLRASGVQELIGPLRRAGLTATPGADADLIDVTGPHLSKATALETIRRRLGVPAERTVAVGDSVNDIEALTWAARGVAMGHAPDLVRAAADEVTGTLHQHGVVDVLRSMTVGR